MVNLQPRLGINWALNDKTVLHLSGGMVDQGLNGLATDWLSFYYNSNTFNQVSSTDGQHWVSEWGGDHGLPAFPAVTGGNLGWVPPLTNNHGLLVCELWRGPGTPTRRAPRSITTTRPTDYMWGLSVQRQLSQNWAITGGIPGREGRASC